MIGTEDMHIVGRSKDGKEYEIIGNKAYLYTLSFTVCNPSIPTLPFTGSGGFAPFLFASMLLVSVGAFFIYIYFIKKRSNANEED